MGRVAVAMTHATLAMEFVGIDDHAEVEGRYVRSEPQTYWEPGAPEGHEDVTIAFPCGPSLDEDLNMVDVTDHVSQTATMYAEDALLGALEDG